MTKNQPNYLLFAQHGWADTGTNIGRLAQTIADAQTLVTAPSLGYVSTFIRIELLIQRLETIVTETITQYPDTPIKILGHSMGGLIWLEVLDRNPQWWQKVHSLVLLGSPVGGSNIARIIDPLGIGIGTAKCLGKNRRAIAETIAQQIPTLSVASDLDGGTDGLVTVENTKFNYANWQLVNRIPHSAMRYHPQMIPIIKSFWSNPQLGTAPATDLVSHSIQLLRSVPGMTDTDYRNYQRSQIIARFTDGSTVRDWNRLGVHHVFVGDSNHQCLYAGYVGLIHGKELQKTLKKICHQMGRN